MAAPATQAPLMTFDHPATVDAAHQQQQQQLEQQAAKAAASGGEQQFGREVHLPGTMNKQHDGHGAVVANNTAQSDTAASAAASLAPPGQGIALQSPLRQADAHTQAMAAQQQQQQQQQQQEQDAAGRYNGHGTGAGGAAGAVAGDRKCNGHAGDDGLVTVHDSFADHAVHVSDADVDSDGDVDDPLAAQVREAAGGGPADLAVPPGGDAEAPAAQEAPDPMRPRVIKSILSSSNMRHPRQEHSVRWRDAESPGTPIANVVYADELEKYGGPEYQNTDDESDDEGCCCVLM